MRSSAQPSNASTSRSRSSFARQAHGKAMLPGGGDLLTAEIREKQARSIKYQMTIAKLPLAKELPSRDFAEQNPAG